MFSGYWRRGSCAAARIKAGRTTAILDALIGDDTVSEHEALKFGSPSSVTIYFYIGDGEDAEEELEGFDWHTSVGGVSARLVRAMDVWGVVAEEATEYTVYLRKWAPHP